MVRTRSARRDLRPPGEPVSPRRDDLVESLYPGARALRRCRRRTRAQRVRRVNRLAAAATPFRPALARAARPPRALRLYLPEPAAPLARLGDARADAAARPRDELP